jgi:inhibitor of KinA sporulation pathway (predicted exonuclease)
MMAAELLANVPVLVIDLEATCDDGDGLPASDMEIIEIGAVWATAEGNVLDTFQALVRPVVRPQLTPFCRQLTNIQQADVDGAELFPAVAARLASFAQRHQAPGATWGSWGQFDAKQLARDCERHGIQNPLAAFEHVNLKRRFAKARKIKEVGMARALQMVGLPLDGAHHRGLDDARNIAKLLPWSCIGMYIPTYIPTYMNRKPGGGEGVALRLRAACDTMYLNQSQ